MNTANMLTLTLGLLVASLGTFGILCWSLGQIYQEICWSSTEKACNWADIRAWAWRRAWEPIPEPDTSLGLGDTRLEAWFASHGLN